MKAYNVAFTEQTPFFSMINTMMSPFLSAISLKNGKAIDVVLFK